MDEDYQTLLDVVERVNQETEPPAQEVDWEAMIWRQRREPAQVLIAGRWRELALQAILAWETEGDIRGLSPDLHTWRGVGLGWLGGEGGAAWSKGKAEFVWQELHSDADRVPRRCSSIMDDDVLSHPCCRPAGHRGSGKHMCACHGRQWIEPRDLF